MTVLVNKTFTEEEVKDLKYKLSKVVMGRVDERYETELVIKKSWVPFVKPKGVTKDTLVFDEVDSIPKGLTKVTMRDVGFLDRVMEPVAYVHNGYPELGHLEVLMDKGLRSFVLGREVMDVLKILEEWNCD